MLRTAFLVGAVTDAIALVPMTLPPMARLLWGFDDTSGAYRFAMGYGASLMLGWTVLLAWAYQRPVERRFIAALTVVVIYGLVITEILAVSSGNLAAWRMAPTWSLQAALLCLFAGGYHHATLCRLIV
jgi:peptidoglycan/LPS O-acetylase OafA/YrhL